MTDFASIHAASKMKLFQELVILLKTNDWSSDIISQAESNCKLNSGYHHALFPGGESQILQEFETWQDDMMLKALSKQEKPQKIRAQIALALETRLMHVIPKSAMVNSDAALLLPQNILTGKEVACRTCDLIWKYAGDKSTDFNYYTKRGLLLPVYLSARVFYVADNSKNHQDTKDFIKNALDNIINIASFKNRIKLPKLEDIPILRLFS
jgi:ubiquinone biosynthesis protein COQ9